MKHLNVSINFHDKEVVNGEYNRVNIKTHYGRMVEDMKYSEETLLNCLEKRKLWYQKSIDMKSGKIPYEKGFDFPYGTIERWEGSIHELCNTIAMIKTKDVY